MYSKEEPGLLITSRHSLVKGQHPAQTTIFHLPFFVFTKDVGFFKNNMAIHCTENSPTLYLDDSILNKPLTGAVFSKFKPMIKAKKGALSHLDDNFWSYFKDLEESLAAKKSADRALGLEDILFEKDSVLLSEPMTPKSEIGPVVSEPELYVLFIKKEFLRKDLLKDFDVSTKLQEYNNFLTLRFKEIEISFNSLITFSALASVIYFF